MGLPSGLLYSASATDIRDATGYLPSPNAATTALMYIDTTQAFSNNPGTRIWLGQPNQFPELVWVSERQTGALPQPSQWTRLQAPSNPTQPTQPPVVQDPCVAQPILCDLRAGMSAEINTTEGDLLNLRSGPSTDYDVIDQLPDGEVVELVEGPRQSDGLLWWRVRTTANQMGWVVERVDDVQTLLATQTAGQKQPKQPAGLYAGGLARVTAEGDNLNARTEPYIDAPVLAILQRGDVVKVLAGPRQADGFTWWQVETPEGPAWAAEGDNVEAWLRPTEQ